MPLQDAFQKATGLSIEEGIKKAIEGGWPTEKPTCEYPVQFGGAYWEPIFESVVVKWVINKGHEGNDDFRSRPEQWHPAILMLDPSFWQALEKAMEWGLSTDENSVGGDLNWRYYQHRFIDFLNS